MRKNLVGSMFVVLVLVFAVGVAGAGENYKGFERGDALITAKDLKQLIDAKDPKLVVLSVAKTTDYRLGHIPGSFQIWRSDYEPAADFEFPYGGMALDREDFQAFAQEFGIDNDSKVVIYDHKYDATRVWWLFYLYGKTDCRVLDGGIKAWKAADYDTNILAPDLPKSPGNFTATTALPGWSVSMTTVWRAKTSDDYQLWDTRGDDEWTGAKLKKGAFTEGRIPWAKHCDWPAFKNGTEFKNADELQKVIDEFGFDKNKQHIFYCQSGVRTTHEMFALYLMGWNPAQLHNYDGSWIEWSYYHKNLAESGAIVVGK
ncbi:MAG: sulfurtransferase [Acidobacteria bacterium]|nr:MAG: sulfurtransferase [Acidobacteriota bacterium]